MLEIKNSVAVITGGGGGIGLSLAKYWVENGGKVVLGDVFEEPLAKAAEEIKAMNGEVSTVVMDVTKEEDNGKLADTAIEQFGAINLVAPFAGIIKDGLLVATDKETGKVKKKMALESFQKVIDINLTGVFLTVRECVERMVNNDCKGLICLVSSTGSLGDCGPDQLFVIQGGHVGHAQGHHGRVFPPGPFGQDSLRGHRAGVRRHPHGKRDEPEGFGWNSGTGAHRRLIEPEEVASLTGELYRNEALAGDVFFIHGGLRLGSRG